MKTNKEHSVDMKFLEEIMVLICSLFSRILSREGLVSSGMSEDKSYRQSHTERGR